MDLYPRDCIAASEGGSRCFAFTGTTIVYSSLSDCYLYFTQIFGKEIMRREGVSVLLACLKDDYLTAVAVASLMALALSFKEHVLPR